MVALTAKFYYTKGLNSQMRAMKRAFKKILTKCKKDTNEGKNQNWVV